MSIIKYLAIITVSSSVLMGCMPESDPQTNARGQKIGPWFAQNSSQAFGGQVGSEAIRGIVYSATTPMGALSSPTHYWLRSQQNDYYAPILSMTLDGVPVNNLSTTGGWLRASGATRNALLADTFLLELQVGSPANAEVRITGTEGDLTASYGQYVMEYRVSSDSGWEPYCPHAYTNEDESVTNLREYMIPIGGASWRAGGRRDDDPNSIQLSCTHDSIGGCVTWGYAPWDFWGSTSLKDTHQACTRMKRADVCGNGDGLTTLNLGHYLHTDVQIWDTHGIHSGSPQTHATMEAWFDTNGATCLNRSQYRTHDQNAIDHLDQLLSSYPCSTLPSCTKASTGLVASARPCTTFDDNGDCVGN